MFASSESLDVYMAGGVATSATTLNDRKTGTNTCSTDDLTSSVVHESGTHSAHQRVAGPADRGDGESLWKLYIMFSKEIFCNDVHRPKMCYFIEY